MYAGSSTAVLVAVRFTLWWPKVLKYKNAEMSLSAIVDILETPFVVMRNLVAGEHVAVCWLINPNIYHCGVIVAITSAIVVVKSGRIPYYVIQKYLIVAVTEDASATSLATFTLFITPSTMRIQSGDI